jgi:FkbM family methyltransferase
MAGELLFDVGMHQCEDTAYYLQRGHRVVAVDADPAMMAAAAERFSQEIAAGRLSLVHAAVSDEVGAVTLHRSRETMWNSLDPAIAGRMGAQGDTIDVPATTLAVLFATFGVPFYCKIDIEGWDERALASLQGARELPTFVSVESECAGESGVDEASALRTLDRLAALGYRRFKLVDQRSLQVLTESEPVHVTPGLSARILRRLGLLGPAPASRHSVASARRAAEAARCGYDFPVGATGPFGDDLTGEWMDVDAARRTLLRHRRDFFRMRDVRGFEFWCDWHAGR